MREARVSNQSPKPANLELAKLDANRVEARASSQRLKPSLKKLRQESQARVLGRNLKRFAPCFMLSHGVSRSLDRNLRSLRAGPPFTVWRYLADCILVGSRLTKN